MIVSLYFPYSRTRQVFRRNFFFGNSLVKQNYYKIGYAFQKALFMAKEDVQFRDFVQHHQCELTPNVESMSILASISAEKTTCVWFIFSGLISKDRRTLVIRVSHLLTSTTVQTPVLCRQKTFPYPKYLAIVVVKRHFLLAKYITKLTFDSNDREF